MQFMSAYNTTMSHTYACALKINFYIFIFIHTWTLTYIFTLKKDTNTNIRTWITTWSCIVWSSSLDLQKSLQVFCLSFIVQSEFKMKLWMSSPFTIVKNIILTDTLYHLFYYPWLIWEVTVIYIVVNWSPSLNQCKSCIIIFLTLVSAIWILGHKSSVRAMKI